jgi:flagellar assembly protein FliH
MKIILRSPKIGQAKKIFQLDNSSFDESVAELEVRPPDVEVASAVEDRKKEVKENQQIVTLKNENKSLQAALDTLQAEHQELVDTIEEHKKSAENQGYKEGYEKSKVTVEAELKPLMDEWEKTVDSLKDNLQNVIFEQEEECVEVVYSAVCRIVGQSAGKKEQIISIVKQVMKNISNTDNQIVLVSSHDYKHLEDYSDFINAHVVQSEDIAYGGCIVKAGSVSLDARL